jgi:hypothetical protein
VLARVPVQELVPEPARAQEQGQVQELVPEPAQALALLLLGT